LGTILSIFDTGLYACVYTVTYLVNVDFISITHYPYPKYEHTYMVAGGILRAKLFLKIKLVQLTA